VRRLLIAMMAAALIAPAAVAPAQQRRAAVQRDWTQTVTVTAEGGYRMGNPAAPVKLVEYLSLTCPHCADFTRDGAPRLIQNYVRTGRVSLEYRNFVLNELDLTASMLSRCATPQNYFALNHAILADQAQWVSRLNQISPAQRQELGGLPQLQQIRRVSTLVGLDAIAARHGVPAARAQACLSSQAGLDRLVAMVRAGSAAGVQGTPTFAINGRIVPANDWASLEPLLRGG
jgi:protein-disulfide isomerase